ncbi:MAG: M20 family metallo-hydrolase [Proteobacteria bacterium]|nr:M20 family metallo-hydrolase [Pseudomonadota bacterium]
MNTPSPTASASVSEERLWQLLMDVATYGATAKGGVNRQALSAEDTAAKKHVVQWAAERGFTTFQDDIGNLFVRRDGTEPTLAPVMTGSHLDSQPTGGRFDGAYGVLAGLEALDALNDAGIQTRRPVVVVAWTNEEGSRYSPGAFGSSIFAGVSDLASVLDNTDAAGAVLRDELARTLAETDVPMRAQGSVTPQFYIEAHIEQGPVLEEKGLQIGVVSSIQGIHHLDVVIIGEEAHAGTTPRRSRKDALSSAVAIISALEQMTSDADDITRFTVGRCEVQPGSPNTVPGRVHFTIDLRHPDRAVLTSLVDRIRVVATEKANPCSVTVTDNLSVDPTIFEAGVMDAIRQSAQALGLGHMDMPSGAGHDAMHLATICSAGMIFVPCLGGVSHNEAESATPGDLAAGARVLADTIVRLAND